MVEYGTHRELYEKGGIYTEMFDKQAQFYRDEKTVGTDSGFDLFAKKHLGGLNE